MECTDYSYSPANQAAGTITQISGGLFPLRDRLEGLIDRVNEIRFRVGGIGDSLFGPRPENAQLSSGQCDAPPQSIEFLINRLEQEVAEIESGLGRF